jgi:type II restriction/modification system DNA methylase subunit YeeA
MVVDGETRFIIPRSEEDDDDHHEDRLLRLLRLMIPIMII